MSTWKPYVHQETEENRSTTWTQEDAKTFGELTPARFLTVDRFAEKYPSFTPYHYATNNPVLFVDVNGDSIWINDNGQRILYTTVMKYTGKNVTIAGVVKALNSIGSFTSGQKVLAALIGSESNYNVMLNQNVDPNTGGNFVANKDGLGGNINIGKGNEDVFTISHESFHAYQNEMGSGGASIPSEMEAYLFSGAITLASGQAMPARYDMFAPAQAVWVNAYRGLMKKWDEAQFWNNGVYGFRTGSPFNVKGVYNPLLDDYLPNQRMLINALYPLKKRRR